MSIAHAKISSNFKKRTTQAIFSIVFFILVYLVLIALAVGLMILCGWLGLTIIFTKANFITLVLGAGIISIGVLTLIFLLKFIFKTHVVDRSHLIEITKYDEPELFAFIDQIVQEVGTKFPHRVYLSTDVNASVFYDSNFWSMFFPIPKNLQIGLGLINSVTVSEFKAILSHEFGHFSQRSMKVGSYVYNVNQIIFNMLYDNESFDNLANSWARVNGTMDIFVNISVYLVRGIQYILKKVYEIVNLSYMSLSREMEFHADAVAANVVGEEPLVSSLLRLDLADHSFNMVLNYYNSKIPEAKSTEDIYTQQQIAMNFLAQEHDIPFENELPFVTIEHLSRYNKSKLNIANQWASHPSMEDRIREIKKLKVNPQPINNTRATALFIKRDFIQSKLTTHLFRNVNYEKPVTYIDHQSFENDLKNDFQTTTFSPIFNHYYDSVNPPKFDWDSLQTNEVDFETLFNSNKVDHNYQMVALELDIATLKQILSENHPIKSFDYDGIKYKRKEIKTLIPQLEIELTKIKEVIHENDKNILSYFIQLSKKQGRLQELKTHYDNFWTNESTYQSRIDESIEMANFTSFIQQTNPFEVIKQKLQELKVKENSVKLKINEILNSAYYQSELTDEIRENLKKYVNNDLSYFSNTTYNETNLGTMFTAMGNYHFLLDKVYLNLKKQLLDCFASLLQKQSNSN